MMVGWTKELKEEVVLCLVDAIQLGTWSQHRDEKGRQLLDCRGLGHDERPFQCLKELKTCRVSPRNSKEVCSCKKVCW